MELTEPEGDFSGGPEAYDSELPNEGGPGSIPDQGTRTHALQLRVHMPQLRPSTAK